MSEFQMLYDREKKQFDCRKTAAINNTFILILCTILKRNFCFIFCKTKFKKCEKKMFKFTKIQKKNKIKVSVAEL